MERNGELEGRGYSSSFFKVCFCPVGCSFCSDSVESWGDKGTIAGKMEVPGPSHVQTVPPKPTRLRIIPLAPPLPVPGPSNSRGSTSAGSDPAFGKE